MHLDAGLFDRVADDGVAQAGGAAGSGADRQRDAGGDGDVLTVQPLAGGLVGEGREVSDVRVVGGDGGLVGLGGVVGLPQFAVAGGVGVLDGLDERVLFAFVHAAEQFDVLELDGLVQNVELAVRYAVGAEDPVGGARAVWHDGHVVLEVAGRVDGGDGVAVEVEGRVGGVDDGLADDPAAFGDGVVACVVAFAVGADVDVVVDVESCRVGGADDDAVRVRFAFGDGGLLGMVEHAAEHVAVGGAIFHHEHDLDVCDVGGYEAAVALAEFRGAVDVVVLASEVARRLDAAPAGRLAVGVEACHVFGVQHAGSFRAVRQEQARHRREAGPFAVGDEDLEAGGGLADRVVERRCHDPDEAVAPVLVVMLVISFDRGDVRLAVVADCGVDVHALEGVERAVVVSSCGGVGGFLEDEAGVVACLDAGGAVGCRPFRFLYAVDGAGAVRLPIFGDVRVFAFGVVAGQCAARVGLADGGVEARGDGAGEAVDADDLFGVDCHSCSFQLAFQLRWVPAATNWLIQSMSSSVSSVSGLVWPSGAKLPPST